MIANSRWKLYSLIGSNIGKNLSDVLRFDVIYFPDLKLTYEDIRIICVNNDLINVYSLKTFTNILRYSDGHFFYRVNERTWAEFDIDSVLNDEIEDIV